jgi:hypothetical protein
MLTSLTLNGSPTLLGEDEQATVAGKSFIFNGLDDNCAVSASAKSCLLET